MKKYDVIIIGSGSGALIIENALSHGLSVALVDKGPIGGTCLNVGCIPSKMLVYPGDRIVDIQESGKLGISAEISRIDFSSIMERMKRTVQTGHDHVRHGIEETEELDFYEGEGRFTGDYTLEIGGEQIRGDRIFIASGARPLIPPVKGIETTGYHTNESILRVTERPESLIIIGGGYIAAEYAHFFAAMGTRVTMIQRNRRLVPDEEPEISVQLKRVLSKRMDIHTNTEAVAARKNDGRIAIMIKDRETGNEQEIIAQAALVAAGRQSNADLLNVEKTGVRTDRRNYISVNEFYETSKKNIWAFGDAIGKKMFKHTANKEASLVWHNAIHGKKLKMDYRAAPHAVFTYPEIASVGMTEEAAGEAYGTRDILVGRAPYANVARGEAMMETEGFAKAIVSKKDWKIAGFHIIGPHASLLIQEVVNAMANDQDIWSIVRAMHIHPALPELILSTFGDLAEPD